MYVYTSSLMRITCIDMHVMHIISYQSLRLQCADGCQCHSGTWVQSAPCQHADAVQLPLLRQAELMVCDNQCHHLQGRLYIVYASLIVGSAMH